MSGSPPLEPKRSVAHRALFCVILAVFVGIGLFRFGDVAGVLEGAGTLNAFGAGALMNAHRLLRGELSLSSLVLYREMTREASAGSLLHVLWHAGFQVLFGGLSITAAAAATLTASTLSVVLVYRIARGLLGPVAGLAAMATFAFAPATVSNARSQAPFAFSTLLILVAYDTCVAFSRNPTWWRGLFLGMAIPAVGYGLSNIWLTFLALPAFLLARLVKDRPFRSRSRNGLLVAAATAGLLVLPQLLHAGEVRALLRGRGEHIFNPEGILFPGLSPAEARRHVLGTNIRFLAGFALGTEGEESTPMPGAVPMLLAFATCVVRAHRPERLLLALGLVLSYLGPLLSVMADPTRCMLLVPAQALLVGCFFADLASALENTSWRRGGTVLIGLAVTALCLFDLCLSIPWLTSNIPLARLRRFVRGQPEGRPVFFFMPGETALPYLRWNPPDIGADSRSRVPVVPMRREDMFAVSTLLDRLDVPGTIVVSWSRVFQSDFTAVTRAPLEAGARVWMASCDVLPFARSEKFLLSYRASSLGVVRLDDGSLTWRIPVPSRLDPAAVLVSFLDAHGHRRELEVELDGLPPATLAVKGSETSFIGLSAVELRGAVARGTHQLRVSTRAEGDPVFVEGVTLLGRISEPD